MQDLIYIVDIIGCSSFAIAGALAAGRKRMDLFGVVVVGCVTALGGGTLRDLLLGSFPVFWIAAPGYVYIATLAAICTFFLARRCRPAALVMMYADAAGLALFTLIGFQKGFMVSGQYSVGIIMGVMSGVAGGIMRDVLCDDVPLIFRREIYASSSLFGALLMALADCFWELNAWTISLSVIAIIGIRFSAIRWNLSLPILVLDRGAEPQESRE